MKPEDGEAPFFVALEDDNLITSVSVHTEQLFMKPEDRTYAEVLLRLELTALWRTWGNGAF